MQSCGSVRPLASTMHPLQREFEPETCGRPAREDKDMNMEFGDAGEELVERASDRLGEAADYIRSRDVKSMAGDLQAWVRKNPGPSLLVAAVVGFAAGRAISRS